MKIIKNKFTGNSDAEVSKSFYTYIGDSDVWFPRFLYSLKNDWINKGFKVSDILIREGKPVLVAPIKNYIPFSSDSHKMSFCPSRSSINNIVRKFIEVEDDSESNKMYEFSFIVEGLGIFRVSYSFDEQGVGMSIRYLDFNLPTLEQMQYPNGYVEFIRNLVATQTVKTPTRTIEVSGVRGGGLVLHVGATGSGKSTSIAAEVGYIAEHITGAIMTYESPIEYRYTATKAPVRQFEVGIDIKKDKEHEVFENVKRHLLRNNPSVAVYGEARTNQEIREVIDAAARGHLIFATIHASSVMEALTTLMSVVKDEPKILENTLKGIIAHKLITNKKGDFIPIYEMLLPDEVIKGHIGKQDLRSISSLFIKEDAGGCGITFQRALNQAVKDDKITKTELDQIKKSIYISSKLI